MNAYPTRASEPEIVELHCKMTGASTSAPTKNLGAKITISRPSTAGIIRFTFTEKNGTWMGASLTGVEDATPGNLKNYSIVWEAYVAPTATANGYVQGTWYNGSGTATDWQTTNVARFIFRFKRTSSTGV